MDIHNTAKTPWKDMDPATKAEINRLVAGGAAEEVWAGLRGWIDPMHMLCCCDDAFRIKPCTENPPLPSVSTRPAD